MFWFIGISFFLSFSLFLCALVSIFFPSSVLEQQLEPFTSAFRKSHGETGRPISKEKTALNKAIGLTSSLVEKKSFASELQSILDQAGLSLKLSEFVFFHFSGTILAGLFGYFSTHSIFYASIFVILATISPLVLIQILKSRRKALFHAHLPDTLSLTAGALKAGYSFVQAISMVTEETKPPISSEFKRVLAEARLGLSIEEALDHMAERVKSINFDWTVMAVKIQKEVGGNLAEILEILAATIRERDRVERQIDVLTAEGKLSSIILFCLPFLLGLVIFILNPSYVQILFTHVFGIAMVAISLILMLIGGIWLKKIISIEV